MTKTKCFTALALPLSLLLAGTSGMHAAEDAPSDAADIESIDITAAAQAALPELENNFEAMRALHRARPRPHVSASDVVEDIGTEPSDLHQWIHQNVGLVPYVGSLRGADGILVDGTGNSLDRALLLAAMLEAGGYEVVVFKGELGADDPQPAWNIPLPTASLPELPAEVVAEIARLQDITHEEAVAAQALDQENRQRLLEDIFGMALPVSEEIADLISTDSAGNVPSITNHWWTGYRAEGATDWLMLDATTADGAVLNGITGEPIQIDALSEWQHTVEISLIAEVTDGAERTEHELVTHLMLPADYWRESVRISSMPLGWRGASRPESEEDLGTEDIDSSGDVLADLYAHEEWWPIIQAGNELVKGASITTNGVINENPYTDPKARAVSTAAAALSGMGAGPSNVTAFWSALTLQITIHTPGSPPNVIRRSIMDIIGPSKRSADAEITMNDELAELRATQALTTTVLSIMPGKPTLEVVDRLQRVENLRAREVLTGVVDAVARDDVDTALDRLMTMPLPNGPLLNWHSLRRQASLDGSVAYANVPQIIALHHTVPPTFDEPALIGVDVISNGIGVLPTASEDAWMIRLRQGVIDTTAEAYSLPETAKPLPGNAVRDMLDADEAWQLLTSAPDPSRSDVSARIQSVMNAGMLVVAQADAPGATSYWVIDPNNGQALGFNHLGHGSQMGEDFVVRSWGGQLFTWMGTMAKAYLQYKGGKGAFIAIGGVACAAAGYTTTGSNSALVKHGCAVLAVAGLIW